MSRERVGRLHLITDERDGALWNALQLAELAVEHGVDVLQYRDKRRLSLSDRRRQLERLMVVLRDTNVACVVNDHPELAAEVGAAGVHVGAADAPPRRARELVGVECVVGATANDSAQALHLMHEPIDYLGVGPVFGTATKANPAPTLGLTGLREVVALVDRPVIAIGSIGAENCGSVLNCGVWGVAVLSAVTLSAEPGRQLQRMRREIDQHQG